VEDYADSHRTPVNQAIHFLGIPILTVAALGLLSKITLPARHSKPARRPNGAWPVLLGAGAWYIGQDRRIGSATSAMLLASYALGSSLSTRALLQLFGLGAVAHLIGHYGFEHKPPRFLSKPSAVFEAPPWLLARWAGLFPQQ
jgi:uncharacterized membrane protein YGL010W